MLPMLYTHLGKTLTVKANQPTAAWRSQPEAKLYFSTSCSAAGISNEGLARIAFVMLFQPNHSDGHQGFIFGTC